MNDHFTRIIVCDFEYEAEGGDKNLREGDLPFVLCMVAHEFDANLKPARTIKMWRGEFGVAPPFDIGDDTLFVAYSAWAELTCFLTLGWEFPKHIWDLHTTYLAASNVLLPYELDQDEARQKRKTGLIEACRAYGIPEGWEQFDKKTIAEDIGKGQWRIHGRDRCVAYCEEDVRKETALLIKQLQRGRNWLPTRSADHVLHWSNYSAKTIALVQARGIPLDMPLWNLVQEHKAAVIGALVRKFDPSQGNADPIFTPEGGWQFERFERWLVCMGVAAWPRTESRRLKTDGDTFRMMSYVPGVAGIHALKDSIRVIAGAKLPIGRDGKNRPSLFPFGTATGRNAHSKSIYNAHAGLRGFIQFPPARIGVYLDWRTQEVGVGAGHSDDPKLKAAYRGGDVYHALAHMCGITNDDNIKRWKNEHPDDRQRMKSLNLAIMYGMSVSSLAKGLDRHPLIASYIIDRHQRTYSRFWERREQQVQAAMLDRKMTSVFGWPLRISHSPNRRTLYNFPMQSGGAEMLRLAAWRLCEVGLIPNMLVHDGILLEVRDGEQIEQAKGIMRAAGREVCNGFEIDVDVDQHLEGGAHYCDKREVAKEMWATIIDVLQEIGALPKGDIREIRRKKR